MPVKANRRCRVPGCGCTAGPSGYCPEHQRRRQQEQDARRPTPQERGYGRQWAAIRRAVLKEQPHCERCEERAVLVHHRDHDTTNNDLANLEALCRTCHEREHAGKGAVR